MALPPQQSGALGPVVKLTLHVWFGAAAWLAIAALAAVAVIIFMEVRVLRTMGLMAACAAGELLVIDAYFGMRGAGGMIGGTLGAALLALVGHAGADVILLCALIALAVAPSRVSLKRTFAAVASRAAPLLYQLGAVCVRLAAGVTRARPSTRPAPLGAAFVPPAAAVPAQAQSAHAPLEETPPAQPPLEEAQPAAAAHEKPVRRPGASMPAAEDVRENVLPAIIEPAPAVASRSPDAVYRRAKSERSSSGYQLPDFALFNPPEKRVQSESSAALVLEETLASFGVSASVTHIERGPSVTRYELTPARGVKVSAIKSLSDNIQLALAAQSVRIEAPIPGKAAVGIEVPNSAVSLVCVREILDYLPKGEGRLSIGLGKDISGRPIVADLGGMPHLLVAGATGAGKSVCLNAILASLLSTCTPDQVQLLLVDPKRVELTSYNGIPHLIKDCITDPKLAAGALYELTKEMDARYERFARAGVRKIEEYNHAYPQERLPYIIVLIDELADLMLVAPSRVETSICRIAQLARATGIHLVVATQRPSVDVITGLIKANIPSRIAFAVSSQIDSRTILDMAGAERLLGRGDMLYLPIDAPKPVRVQGALVTGAEIERLCEFWRAQEDPHNRIDIELSEVQEDAGGPADDLALEAARLIIERQMASVALLQAELKVGHPRAVRLIKILEEYRVVGPSEGTKPRKIIAGHADLDQLATILAPRDAEQTLL